MKRILLPILIAFAELSSAQSNYYTFNTDSLWTEDGVKSAFETVKKSVPSGYILVPTIYHKVLKNDSIINYVQFVAEKRSQDVNDGFKLKFKQDSVFLLLNKKLPSFTLTDLKGNAFSSENLMGKPALLNYWAIYCGPCIAEMPELSELKNRYGSEMNFIALTENTCKDDDLLSFLDKHPFNYYILQNAANYKRTLKIDAIPRNIFVDKDGYIRYIQSNFPYTKFDPANGIREYDKNNYFVKIIEELIKRKN
ncbi:MAG: TlpA family protein disulfide reductase [Sphingobacteriaceae bacterium]